MKSKKNKIAFIIVFLFGTVIFWLVINNKDKGTIKKELSDFAVKDTASINKIFIADKQNKTVILTRVSTGGWKVNDKYSVRTDAINVLLKTVQGLEVLMPVGKNARPNIIKALAAASVKVEVYQNDKFTKLYYVGGETQDQTGTYMLLADPETGENSAVPFVMFLPGHNGYLTARYFTSESEWRGRVIFSYNPLDIRSVKVEFPRKKEQSFEIMNNGNNIFDIKTLADNKSVEGFDTLSLKQYLAYYQDIEYETLVTGMQESKRDSIIASGAENVITVTDSKGKTNKVKLILKKYIPRQGEELNEENKDHDPDRMYAVVNNDREISIVQYFVFGKLMPDISYFKRKAKV